MYYNIYNNILKYIIHLSFRSRKYDDKFAEALCGILCKLLALQKLE